jgi:hypothetical protein
MIKRYYSDSVSFRVRLQADEKSDFIQTSIVGSIVLREISLPILGIEMTNSVWKVNSYNSIINPERLVNHKSIILQDANETTEETR